MSIPSSKPLASLSPMKRFLRSVLMLSTIALSLGQAQGQSLRVEAGVNASNVHITTPQVGYSGDVRLGYRLGLGAEIPLNARWYFAPMLMVKSGGAQLNLQANLTGDAKRLVSVDDLPTTPAVRSILDGRVPQLVEHEAFAPLFVGMQMRPFAPWLGIKLEAGSYVGYTFSSRLTLGSYAFNLFDLETLTEGIVERHAWDAGVSGSIALSIHRVYLNAGLEYGLLNRFCIPPLSPEHHTRLEEYLSSTPALSGLRGEGLTSITANNLNFFLTLGVTL